MYHIVEFVETVTPPSLNETSSMVQNQVKVKGLFVYLFVSLFVCLSACLFDCLILCLFVFDNKII